VSFDLDENRVIGLAQPVEVLLDGSPRVRPELVAIVVEIEIGGLAAVSFCVSFMTSFSLRRE